MGIKSRGRSMTEVIVAVTFISFLTGFVFVLCLGNWYRAKRAMERQRQRRLEKMNGTTPRSSTDGSPGGSHASNSTGTQYSQEHDALLRRTPSASAAAPSGFPPSRFPAGDGGDSLLLNEEGHRQFMSV
uniref:Uncharacterized protein n=1 Tax=Grammatophora oceanica TaxID=210454 RepID=A0A7S1Y086_9STRA|mmetsp:Transcript_14096/g.20645  ORF Transcript_14096/g.20645 Transcript_14096/m.20645 type:complete len:129 (+) Transcript_14096:118-504(+)